MAFCTNCGSKVGDGDRFCDSCGAPLQANPAAAPHVPPYTPPTPNPATTPYTPPYTPPTPNPYARPYTPPVYSAGKSNVGMILAIISLCTAFFALVSFFMPLLSGSVWGYSVDVYGSDILEISFDNMDEPECLFAVLAFLASIAAIVVAAISIKVRGCRIATIITSAVALICLFISMGEDMENMGIGFILYILFHVATIVLASIAVAKKPASPARPVYGR